MKIRVYIYILSLLVLFGALGSCHNKSEIEPVEKKTAKIKIKSRSSIFSSDLDSKVTSLRVIAFDNVNHLVSSNTFYSQASLDGQLIHSMTTGLYDFVFIANEPTGAISVALNDIIFESDLRAIEFPAQYFNTTDIIPMSLTVRDVEVLSGDLGVKIDNSAPITNWIIQLKKLAARFDFVLKSEKDLNGVFGGVQFDNLADNVPIIYEQSENGYLGTHTTQRSFSVDEPQDLIHFRDTVIAGYAWAKIVERIIVPSFDFYPSSDPEKAAALRVILKNDENVIGCTLGVDEENYDYSLPRNKQLKVEGTLEYPMEVNIGVQDWEPQAINGDINVRKLTVSQTDITVYDGAVSRLYFWSNQPSVFVEPIGYTGATGTTEFQVNTIFDDITTASSPHLVYDPATGVGYLDIASLLNTSNTTQNRIILNANGLLREVRIRVENSYLPATLRFVSAFYKWNQVGERIISLPNANGAWSAEVISGADFIKLDRNHSPAMMAGIFYTINNGNPEDYLVSGTATTVSGNGRIFFRIGMKSTAANSTTVRFGAIRLTAGGNESLILVRQGEQPVGVNNTLLWTVYNLNDPLMGLGGANFTDHSSFLPRQVATTPNIFTDYPSLMGYFVRWNLYNGTTTADRRILNPTQPMGAITGFPTTFAASWNANNDPCPTGYRHPTSAEFTTFSQQTTSIWGLCADGFYDRGEIVGNNQVWTSPISRIGASGRVFYNPTTYASIFLPATSWRTTNGATQPNWGMYASSTATTSPNFFAFSFTASAVTPASAETRLGAYPVRCVVQ